MRLPPNRSGRSERCGPTDGYPDGRCTHYADALRFASLRLLAIEGARIKYTLQTRRSRQKFSAMDFDAERFIIEIQNRPAIWNTKSAEYSDRNLRQKAWEELVDTYGADLPQDKKKQLGLDLQKKWRNIRDAFVKAHKAKESKSGSAAKKKVPYVFYDNLLFLKDTVTVNSTDGNVTVNEDVNMTTQNEDNLPLNTPLTPKRRKNKKYDDAIGAQLVGVLTINVERRNLEDDEDRLFFLSLVKEYKKIPEHLQMQTKLDILRLIKDAQQLCNYPNTSWGIGKNDTNRGYQTAHYSRYNPYTQPMQSSDIGRPPSQGSAASSLQNIEVQSPLSTYSQQSQNSQHSSYMDLFNSIPDDCENQNV